MSYGGFERFVAPARRDAALWKTALGALVIVVLYGAGAGAIIAAGGWLSAGQISASDLVSLRAPGAVLIVLASFAAMAAAVLVVTRIVHRRPVATLWGDPQRLVRDFLSTAVLAIGVGALGLGAVMLIEGVAWSGPLGRWLFLLPLALPLVALQTGAEELVFRGYLLQQLGARFGVGLRVAWMIVPSLLFAVLHIDPTSQGANLLPVLAVITLFAVIAADLTARTGTLGAAWGLHFINNVQALLIVSLDGPLSGLSLGRIALAADAPAALPLFAADAAALLLFYALWRWRHG